MQVMGLLCRLSLGVQNGNENLSVLMMLDVYAALLGLQAHVPVLMGGLGQCVTGCMALRQARQARRR